ncbi:hypothetical protein [Nesterenkonia muleiensis]|uniref:hypothetical protein n=1 Tax=Nesterenkonia muleiensis TaxID=2282648 RepID=UPI000E723871|nr:hypothetical protein [Nesterenkonia muleiensis]
MKTSVKIDRFYISVKTDRTWLSGYGQVYNIRHAGANLARCVETSPEAGTHFTPSDWRHEVTTEPGAPCQAC